MNEESSYKITPPDQNDPHPARTLFLNGVLAEAQHQGYGTEDQGRLLVFALRTWEKR